MDKQQLRDKIFDLIMEASSLRAKINIKGLSVNQCYHIADQILALFDEEAIRKDIINIIKEYNLESASVRDDALERKAKGWKLLQQALMEKK